MTEHVSRVRLTAGRVAEFKCPAGKPQAFLWDTESPSLLLRVTPTGRKTFAFEARLSGSTIRVAIGTASDWTLSEARRRASELKQQVDSGQDPRELVRKREAEKAAIAAKDIADSVTVADAWARYVVEGRPKRKDAWKPRYLADLKAMAAPGGEKRKRGAGVTEPGYIFPLLVLRLSDVTEDSLGAWFEAQSRRSKHQATRALMMFRGFLRWCSARPEYRHLVERDAGKAAAIVEAMPRSVRRTDALESAQVAGWWSGAEQLSNRIASAYLRALLLTGARREEIAALRWADVDFQWRKLTIADKVDETRTIPLSPYMCWMLETLPRAISLDGKASEYVFASASKSGRIVDARASHAQVLSSARIDHLTFHGLRRSYALLGEAAGAPAGAIAQVMGHRPSATAEGYRPRSVDALRSFVALIEGHILCLAGVQLEHCKT